MTKANRRLPMAMLLAAGRGRRMRPLSDARPKPLIEIGGKPMIEFSLERLEKAARHIIVNARYRAPMIVDYCRSRAGTTPLSVLIESRTYDSGGGVLHALPRLGADPFFLLNGDIVWNDGPGTPALQRLREGWDEGRMDALLLLIPLKRAFGCPPPGDFIRAADGRLDLPSEGESSYVFSGIQLIHPRLFESIRQTSFPLSRIYERARLQGRLYGLEHDGEWYHVGDVAMVEELRRSLPHPGPDQ